MHSLYHSFFLGKQECILSVCENSSSVLELQSFRVYLIISLLVLILIGTNRYPPCTFYFILYPHIITPDYRYGVNFTVTKDEDNRLNATAVTLTSEGKVTAEAREKSLSESPAREGGASKPR